MKKMLFVFNPHTGGGKLKNKILDILCIFKSAGYIINAYPTSAEKDALNIVKKCAEHYDMVVCCGGDGTLNEVVNGLYELKNPPPLGYIPGGTTNDFATSLSIPKNDMIKAAKKIVECKKPALFDIGIFNQRAFNYVAAFGAFTDVSYATPQKKKNKLGYFAYILQGAQQLPNLKTQHVHVETDTGEVIEDDFLYGMISNTTSVGGFSYPSNINVELDDGLFEMVLLRRPQNFGEYTQLPDAVFKGQATSAAITALKVKSATFTSPEEISWTLDGEFGGAVKESHFAVQKKAIKICV